MNKKSNKLNVITKTKDLCEYVYTITHKSPKEYRFTIVVKMQNYCLEALDKLHRANDVSLSLNKKTQIIAIKNGVEYLGWRFYLTNTGKVVKRLKKHTKKDSSIGSGNCQESMQKIVLHLRK